MYEWLDNPASIDPTFSLLPADEQQAILAIFHQAARDVSTTTSRTTAGSSKTFKGLKTSIDLSKFADIPRLPKLTLAEKVKAEVAICEGCDGTDCPKEIDKWQFPKVDSYGNLVYRSCKFGEQRQRQRELQNKFRSSRIPARYLGKTFADYQVDGSNRTAVDYARKALTLNYGAYFYGECGTGKTFLASLIAQDFLKNGKSVLFTKVPSLLDDIRATFNGNGKELDLLDELQAANLVVLDDFGMEKPTQWAGSTLCKVLDMRYDNPTGKTIITSNLSPDELAYRLNNASDGQNLNGSRIADRCREICEPILLKGTTRRN